MAEGPTPGGGRRVRRLRATAVFAVALALGGIAALVASLVADDGGPARLAAVDPVAPVALPGGRVAWAERTTGVVRVVDVDGWRADAVEELARVPDELRTDGQRGLLGLAHRTRAGVSELYASWTRADDGRLVVGRLGEDGALVWEGPVSTELANGGALVFRDDRLLLGVGELQDPDTAADPSTPNGKVVSLDPDGPPDQEPEVVSGPWHNPFALTVVDGEVWLLDNAPGDVPERIARVSASGEVVAELPGRRAPASATGDGAGNLLVCGFVSGTVERFPIPDEGVPTVGSDTGRACATGVAVVDDRVVTTTTDEVLRFGEG